VVYSERLDPRPGLIYSSVTYADDKLYAISQDHGTYVLAAEPAFKVLAVNAFSNDTNRVNGSIVVANNRLILRTDQAIYCIGK
jgi:outer membrane protein assembly factor BamB